MTDNDEDEVFTDQQKDAIHQAIRPYLKPDADFHGKILFSIGQVVDAVSGGGAHPHNVLYECDIKDGRTALLAKLDAAEQEYDQLVNALQAHVEAQRRIPERCAECDYLTWRNWAAVAAEHTETKRNRQFLEFTAEFGCAPNVVSPTGFEPVLLP